MQSEEKTTQAREQREERGLKSLMVHTTGYGFYSETDMRMRVSRDRGLLGEYLEFKGYTQDLGSGVNLTSLTT